MIGREMKLEEKTLETVELAGLLHDIGKIGIPEEILHKADKLDEPELMMIRRHPINGLEILRSIKEFADIIPGILHHHEHYDGSGYPDGLKGSRIPLLARMIAVADTFDAMTSDRPYRKALSVDEAVDELQRCSGTQFDPDISEAFIRVLKSGKIRFVEAFDEEKQDSSS